MAFFIEVPVAGLLAGVMYSLVAIAFVLIYKASGVFNFAQGAMVLFAALTFVNLTAHGTSLLWYPPNAGGVRGYLASLAKIGQLPLTLVYPGHHIVLRGADAIAAVRRETVRIVRERDRRILTELLAGPASFARLDDLVYDAAVREVIPWASSVTMAHVRHLEECGTLYRRPDRLYVTDAVAAQRYLRTLDDLASLPGA